MRMPIVSFVPMAMNESVCATCCYRMVAAPTNYYTEVLHGGWLENQAGGNLVWREEIDTTWSEFSFDVDFTAHEGLIAVPFLNKDKNEWQVSYHQQDAKIAQMSLNDFLHGDRALGKIVNDNCTHIDGQCFYINAIAQSEPYTQHLESTSPHASATGYHKAPHQAIQFNS